MQSTDILSWRAGIEVLADRWTLLIVRELILGSHRFNGSERPAGDFALTVGVSSAGPPPALGSRRYARDFDEIKEVGSSASGTRTHEQTDLARFRVSTGPQNWNPVARQAAMAQDFTLVQNVRALALLNLAGADAFIAAWDAQFALQPVAAADGDSWGRRRRQSGNGRRPVLDSPARHTSLSRHRGSHDVRRRGREGTRARVFGQDPGVVITLNQRHRTGSRRDISDLRRYCGWRRECPRVGRNPLENLERARSDRRRTDRALCRASLSRAERLKVGRFGHRRSRGQENERLCLS